MTAVGLARSLATGWLAGAVPDGLVLVGPDTALDVVLPGGADAGERAAPLMVRGVTPSELGRAAAITPDEVDELLGALERSGAFSDDDPANGGENRPTEPVLAAFGITDADDGAPAASARDGWRVISTADEVLLVPAELPPARLETLLRDFVAGVDPRQRRRAYSHALARGAGTVWGDQPPPQAVDTAVEGLAARERDSVYVIDLRDGSELALPVADIGRVGAERQHRLGTILRLGPLTRPAISRAAIAVAVAEYPAPDPALMESDELEHRTKGMARGDAELAELIARAEAAERYATGDAATVELHRAAFEELDDAVEAHHLYAFNRRQYAAVADRVESVPAQRRLWVPARRRDGSHRWVPAEAVLCACAFTGPEGPGPAALSTSNGVAAGSTVEDASRSALRELVERDAFLWTWVQRVSRERIDPASLPGPLRDDLAMVAPERLEVSFVNLTLETEPVILCVIHGPETLSLGARCHADPARAAEGAFWEAAVTRLGLDPPDAPPAPEEVSEPIDHENLYRVGPAVERAEFLFSADETISLDRVRGSGEPVEGAIAAIGEPVEDPLFVDLSSPRTRPFHVIRALVPGLVPISFGHDREPLGAPLLSRPRRTADGRTLGEALDLEWAGPLFPHPFA